jgi:hypothetical protein
MKAVDHGISFTMQLPEEFLPKLPKKPVSRDEQIQNELSAIRRIDRKKAMPEVVDFLKQHSDGLKLELAELQRKSFKK